LVTVKVGVEGSTHQWVQLNGFSFDQLWLKSLNTQTVKRWSPVQQYRMTLQHIFKDIPYYWIFAVHNFLGRLYSLNNTSFDQLPDDKRLEELSSHILRQTTLVKLQLGTYYEYRTTGVVHPLTQKVLTETTLLTFPHIRKGFQSTVTIRPHCVDLS